MLTSSNDVQRRNSSQVSLPILVSAILLKICLNLNSAARYASIVRIVVAMLRKSGDENPAISTTNAVLGNTTCCVEAKRDLRIRA